MSAWALRLFITRKTVPMRILLNSLIISKLEYASILWSPTDQRNISKLENVQRRYTSKIAIFRRHDPHTGLMECTTNYWERLDQLKIYSLERRRDRYMMIYMYKILIGLVPNVGFQKHYNVRTKITFTPKSTTRAPAWVKTIRYSSFFTKGPMLYNLLPEELRELEDFIEPTKSHVDHFKRTLDQWLTLLPDQPTTHGLVRQAKTNSILDQMAMHGSGVRRNWKDLIRAKGLPQINNQQ